MNESNAKTRRLPRRSLHCKSKFKPDPDSKSNLNKDNFQTAFAEHEKYKMNLAKIKRKKIPVQAGRSNALPPLDEVVEREKSAPIQGTEGYSTIQDKVKEVVSSTDTPSVTNKTMLANKKATSPENPAKKPALKSEDQKP